MSDLVKRLRAMGAAQRPHIGDEAADEIERLEQRLELALGASRNPEDIVEIERLTAERDIARKAAHDTKSRDAEIERLRAAVKAAEKAFLQDGDIRGAALMRAALGDDDE